jgi:DNA (cytosine-5)-methyltransferase 1
MYKKYNAVDLFAGCGGLSQGLIDAGFDVIASVEYAKIAAETYKLNYVNSTVFECDIRQLEAKKIVKVLDGKPLHLLAGCPPCQGFSSIRRLNKKISVRDDRNSLVMEYLRFVKELKPLTIMMENVPWLREYYLFDELLKELTKMDYKFDVDVINVKDYEVPQRRKRLVLIGSLLGEIEIAKGSKNKVTVRDTIEKIICKDDPLHKMYAKHTKKIMEQIKLTPKDGGSREDLPETYMLECHKKKNVGFHDIYGRLRWDDYSSTITGGCLNPSKGRFLHPTKNRALTAREAALLQTFPIDYKFPENATKTQIALMIGNALPPKFSYFQSKNIIEHLEKYHI